MPEKITEKQINDLAELEGWGIFGPDGEEQIQTLDEGPEHGPNEGVRQFGTDTAAKLHVIAKAAAGSAIHQAALERIGHTESSKPLWQVAVIETIQREVLYIVEADDVGEALASAKIGLVVDEQGEDPQVLGRKITTGPVLLSSQTA